MIVFVDRRSQTDQKLSKYVDSLVLHLFAYLLRALITLALECYTVTVQCLLRLYRHRLVVVSNNLLVTLVTLVTQKIRSFFNNGKTQHRARARHRWSPESI